MAGWSVPAPDGIGARFTDRSALTPPPGVHRLLAVRQVHGTTVATVDGELDLLAHRQGGEPSPAVALAAGDRFPSVVELATADAIVAVRAPGTVGLGLMIRVADCLPVLLADSRGNYLAVAHAGRVGLLDGVLIATVERLRALGAGELRAWIGPHICGSCYEVPATMFDDAVARLPAVAARTSWDTPGLDLAAGAAAQLGGLGIVSTVVGPCTRETPELLHSYRRDAGAAGRQTVIGWFTPRRGW